MKIDPYEIIIAENEEEQGTMGNISLLILMGNQEKAKKLAEERNLLDYFNVALKEYGRGHNGLHRKT